MHKKSRSKKGPRHPPQSNASKAPPVDPDPTPPLVIEIEESKNEQRVPDPNPEPILDTIKPESSTTETSVVNTPSKPKRHRGGRKKKQVAETTIEETTAECVSVSEISLNLDQSKTNKALNIQELKEEKENKTKEFNTENVEKAIVVAKCTEVLNTQSTNIKINEDDKKVAETMQTSCEPTSLNKNEGVCDITLTSNVELKSTEFISADAVQSNKHNTKESTQITKLNIAIDLPKEGDSLLTEKQEENATCIHSDNNKEDKLNQSFKDIKQEPKMKGQGKKSKRKLVPKGETPEETTQNDPQKPTIPDPLIANLPSVSVSDVLIPTTKEVVSVDDNKSDKGASDENQQLTSLINISPISDTTKNDQTVIIKSTSPSKITKQDDNNLQYKNQEKPIQSNEGDLISTKPSGIKCELGISSEKNKCVSLDASNTPVIDDKIKTADYSIDNVKSGAIVLEESTSFVVKPSDGAKHKENNSSKKKGKGQKHPANYQQPEIMSSSQITQSVTEEKTKIIKEVKESSATLPQGSTDNLQSNINVIVGPSEPLADLKSKTQTEKSDNVGDSVEINLSQSTKQSKPVKSTDLTILGDNTILKSIVQENVNLDFKDNLLNLSSLLEKEPVLMICDKGANVPVQKIQSNLLQKTETETLVSAKNVSFDSLSEKAKTSDFEKSSKSIESLEIDTETIKNVVTSSIASLRSSEAPIAIICDESKKQSASIYSTNTGLTIAEEIAESIKKELKCQLAIISGSQGNISQKPQLTEQNIKDIGEETEKNVLKNIESILESTEHTALPKTPDNKGDTVCKPISSNSNTQNTTAVTLDTDKNQHKGKGKSKKGNKKDIIDSHTSTQITSSSTTLSTVSSASTTEKPTSDGTSKASDTKKDSQNSSNANQQKDSDKTENKDSNKSSNKDNSAKEEEEIIYNDNDYKNDSIAREIGYFCIEDDKDSIVTFNERNNSCGSYEYVQQVTDGTIEEQSDSKDDQNDSKDDPNDSKDDQEKTSVIRPKNLLSPPNIPVSSSKDDFKKEKNKANATDGLENAHVKSVLVDKENLPEPTSKGETKNIKLISENSPINSFQQLIHLGGHTQKTKMYENDVDSDDNEEFVYKYNFRNVFLANACHLCKLPVQNYRSHCEYCKLISYCSDTHKDSDWPQHQPLCYAVTTIMQINDLKHLYSKSSSLSGHEYRILRMQMIVLCEKLLKRKLLPSEQETLLYPRLCVKQDCKEWQVEKLRDCGKCGQVSYCNEKPDHLITDHENWCKSYKIYHKLVAHQLQRGKVEPKLPNRILPQGYILPDNCKVLMEELYNKNIGMDDCQYATLSQLSTAPLTALYSYQLWQQKSDPKNNILTSNKLTIHIVGAEMQFEIDTLNKWEAFFMHFCPRLKELQLIFVGPELNTSKLPLDILSRIRLCKFCRQTNKNIKIQFKDGILYHDFIKDPSFSRPDLVCAFNPGLHRTTGFAGQDTWPDTICSIINMAVPFCVTSYTKQELPRDLARVLHCTNGNTKTYIAPRLNPYASIRPDRNFISDDEMPLIFKNYYFMVLSGQS